MMGINCCNYNYMYTHTQNVWISERIIIIKTTTTDKKECELLLRHRHNSDDAVRFILEFIFWLLQLPFFILFCYGRHDADIITDIFMLTHVQFNGKND